MEERRWRDPRTLRIWKVSACRIASPPDSTAEGDPGLVLCFESTATPRAAHSVRCCPGVGTFMTSMDDQSLALCLDAAIAGGLLWVDPRDRQLWWVREDGGKIRFVGCGAELGAGSDGSDAGFWSPEGLMALRDRAAARTAA